MLHRSLLLTAFLLMGMTACGSEHRQDAPSRIAGDGQVQAEAASGSVSVSPGGSTGLKPGGDPERKRELLAQLEQIRRANEAGKRDNEVQTLITELSALARVLGITAEVLDRDGAFAAEIGEERRRFSEGTRARSDDAGRILNGMSGVYGMYALLAKMRFVGSEEKQAEIQDIHDRTVETLTADSPVVEAAAAIADACYELSGMIIRDIDSEARYEKAFAQIELQYRQGARVASKREDVFINGMFRTYEISQLWLLSINPKATDLITELNAGVSEDSGSATNVGMQMGVAAKYLFMISYLIAQATVNTLL